MSDAFITLNSQEKQEKANTNASGLFYGVVTGSDPTTFVVEVNPYDQKHYGIQQGMCLSSCLSHALGIKESCLPQIGAEVLCFPMGPTNCVVFGINPRPDSHDSPDWFPSRAGFGAGDGRGDSCNTQGYFNGGEVDSSKAILLNNLRPTDIVSGDYALSNEFGVLLGLFQQFAVLKGSELAQVQTHVLDDLVRIVSHNFQHFTCLGETKVFHDGQGMHVEFGATHDALEAQGRPQVEAVNSKPTISLTGAAPQLDDSVQQVELENERMTAVSRFRGFVGALSDFVNLMIVRPADRTKVLDGSMPTVPEKGLFNMHVGTDGVFSMRSLGGIFFEKTNWIRVPERIMDAEDPQGDDAATVGYAEKEAFTFDQSVSSEGRPYLYFLQLRDYLAHLQDDLAYRNFKRYGKDFYVNDDFEKETSSETVGAVHPKTKVKYEPRTSGAYLMPNGGITFRDAWGSAIVMEGGNIFIQPAKDLMLQPLRHMVGKVGSNVSLEARKDIDLSSDTGGFRLKTEKAQYLYSNKSGIMLHSNTDMQAGDYYPDPKAEALEKLCGIVFHSPNAGVYTYGKESYARTTERSLVYSKNVIYEASDLMHLLSRSNLSLYSKNATLLTSDTSLIATARTSAILVGDTSTVIGKDGQAHALSALGPVTGFLKQEDVDNLLEQMDEFSAHTVLEYTSNFREDASFTDIQFRYLKSAAYNLGDPQVVFPQTLGQQEAVLYDNPLSTWEEKAINETYPFPGKDLANSFATCNIQNLKVVGLESVNKTAELISSATLSKAENLFEKYTVL